MMKLVFDVRVAGARLEQVPRCFYEFVTVYNNSQYDFSLFKGNSRETADIIGACPAYTILTFPHEKITDSVNIVWDGPASLLVERCKIFFTVDNLALVGQFRPPQAAPSTAPALVRALESWAVSGESAVNSALTISRAGEAGRKHIITAVEVVIRGAAAAVDIPVTVSAPSIIWRAVIGSGSPSGSRTGMVGVSLGGATGSASSVSVPAGGAGVIIAVNLAGYTI